MIYELLIGVVYLTKGIVHPSIVLTLQNLIHYIIITINNIRLSTYQCNNYYRSQVLWGCLLNWPIIIIMQGSKYDDK
jgi:hypothetical protein